MSMGSFLAGLFLGSNCSSNTTIHEQHTSVVNNPIQYPDDWDDFTTERKLEWLKNRCYWHEYYELQSSHREYVKVQIVDDDGDIYNKVMNSIIENKGDKTEAEQLFSNYLNDKYMYAVLNDTTRMKIQNELDRMNDYIKHNYSLISQFSKPVENYYFNNVKISY